MDLVFLSFYLHIPSMVYFCNDPAFRYGLAWRAGDRSNLRSVYIHIQYSFVLPALICRLRREESYGALQAVR